MGFMSSGAREWFDRKYLPVDSRVSQFREYFNKHHPRSWKNRHEIFWWLGFLDEFWELTLSLLGLHKDPPELELLQLSAMAANWIEMREEGGK